MKLPNTIATDIIDTIRGVDTVNQLGLEPLVKLNIRIDRQDKEKLEELAYKDRKTLSEYIRLILEKHARQA